MDDDEVDRFAIVRSLQKSEGEVTTVSAKSAEEAKRLLEETTFDIVFMDYLLPDSDGITLLKSTRSKGYKMPIIMVTSQGDEALAVEALRSGASDYISKRLLTPEGIGQALRNVRRMAEAEELQRKAELALRESEAHLAETQRIGRIGGWEIRLPDVQTYWSTEIFRILGYEENEFVPSFFKYLELLHPADRNKAKESFAACVQTGQPFRVDVRFRDKDGILRYIEIHGRPLKRDETGKVTDLIGTIQDITSRKVTEAELRHAKEKAERSDSARQEFLANMSHEIRTPLNSILGFAHLLEETELSEQQHDYLGAINTAGKALLEIINDILDLSKMEAGKLLLHTTAFDLHQLLTATLSIFRPGVRDKQVEMKVRIEKDVPAVIWGDEARLRQVLVNLISNAIKFTAEGWVKATVKPLNRTEDEIWLRFEIEDTGVGIAWEKQEAIFERFMQAEASTSRAYGGSGLGLTICKRIVELQGGRIGVNSQPGWGSTFWFEIPYALKGSSAEMSEKNTQAHPPMVHKNLTAKILVVEDNLLNQMLVGKILSKAGYTITIAGNGKEAMEKLKQGIPDLILMDVQMPEMDGREATQLLRQDASLGCTQVPVLGMTAHAVEEELQSCLRSGMNDYLVKPIVPEEMLRKVAWLLGGKLAKVGQTPAEKETSHLYKYIRPEELGEVSCSDKGIERELIILFQKESVSALGRMEKAVESGDWEGVYQAAHFIKPSFYLFGVHEARDLFPRIEKWAKNHPKPGEGKDLMESARALHDAVLDELGDYLATLG